MYRLSRWRDSEWDATLDSLAIILNTNYGWRVDNVCIIRGEGSYTPVDLD